MINVGLDFFGFILFAFTQLPEPVGLCLFPNLGSFHHYFLSASAFSANSLSFQDSDDLNVRSFVMVPQVPKVVSSSLVYFFLLFSLSNFCFCIFEFLCPFHSAVEFINLAFYFSIFQL